MKKLFFILEICSTLFLCACCASTGNTNMTENENAIDEKIYVPINGTQHYLLLRGDDIENNIILYIHGGPGLPNTSILYQLIEGLKDNFTFVAYDQRGVGRTYYETQKTNPEENIISKELLLDDLDEIVDYLCQRFNKDKVIIMGHSYGSLIGITYVNEHPDKVLHYIGSAQSVKRSDVMKVTYTKARGLLEDGSKKQQKLDEEYNEYVNGNGKKAYSLQKHINKILDKTHEGLKKPNVVKLALSSPDFKSKDLRYYASIINFKKVSKRNVPSFEWLGDANLFLENTTFTVPLSFISGEYDETCPLELIKDYIDVIKAPYVNFVIIPKAAHSLQLSHSKEVAEAIQNELKYLIP